VQFKNAGYMKWTQDESCSFIFENTAFVKTYFLHAFIAEQKGTDGDADGQGKEQ
jgi:hypothetical protein